MIKEIACDLCQKPAEKKLTWANGGGSGIGACLQGGPMCNDCMEFMWDALSRFPNAKETVTIWPITWSAVEAAP